MAAMSPTLDSLFAGNHAVRQARIDTRGRSWTRANVGCPDVVSKPLVFRKPHQLRAGKMLENQTSGRSSDDVAEGVTAVAKAKGKRVALYLRVSTSEQTTHNQRRQLQAVAARHKWEVVGVFEDAGVSGAKGREHRPGLDAMMKVVARREVDMVAAWSVDRLGRSLIDLLGLLGELHSKGVDLFLHQQGLDTSTPSGRAMFQMMGVFAEFERAMIRERVLAGIARARDQGTQLGRRRLEDTDSKKVAAIRSARKKGVGIRRIARDLGVGVGTVLRLTAEA
jgi:DNA invertase Pin-like site-specific DNA recombinase